MRNKGTYEKNVRDLLRAQNLGKESVKEARLGLGSDLQGPRHDSVVEKVPDKQLSMNNMRNAITVI